jgi:hypothetical protein
VLEYNVEFGVWSRFAVSSLHFVATEGPFNNRTALGNTPGRQGSNRLNPLAMPGLNWKRDKTQDCACEY